MAGNKAIFFFSNGIGNLVMLMPAIQALRELTGQPVDMLLNSDWQDYRRNVVEDILTKWPTVGKVISHPRHNFNPQDYGYWFFSLHSGNVSSMMPFKQYMKHTPIPKPEWGKSMIHETDHYMELAYSMGYEGPIPKIEFPLADGPVLNLLRPVIGFCNGAFATTYWEKKRWPHFGDLAGLCRSYFGGSTVGIGLAGELRGVPVTSDFCGKLSITQTAKMISQFDILVTTDTGNMHIADAMGVPVVALFGSTLVSKNGPRGAGSTVLRTGIDCAPCQDTPLFLRCQHNGCMEAIPPGEVMAVLRIKLSNGCKIGLAPKRIPGSIEKPVIITPDRAFPPVKSRPGANLGAVL